MRLAIAVAVLPERLDSASRVVHPYAVARPSEIPKPSPESMPRKALMQLPTASGIIQLSDDVRSLGSVAAPKTRSPARLKAESSRAETGSSDCCVSARRSSHAYSATDAKAAAVASFGRR